VVSQSATLPRQPGKKDGALVELRDEGKIRHIGLSGASPEILERAEHVTPIAAVQNRFNLIDRSGVEVRRVAEDAATVSMVALRFHSLRGDALSKGASRDLIEGVIQERWKETAP